MSLNRLASCKVLLALLLMCLSGVLRVDSRSLGAELERRQSAYASLGAHRPEETQKSSADVPSIVKESNMQATPSSNYGNLTLVADGFTWVENIFFDGRGAMYFSESYRGEIYRVTVTGNGTFELQMWLSGFGRCLGFALTQDGSEMFAVAWSSSSTYDIIVFSLEYPNTFRYITSTPHSGNGLGLDTAANVLYTTTEDDFVPNQGAIYAMGVDGVFLNTTTNASFSTFAANLNAADGLWIDERTRILYMSEVLNATVRLYNLSLAGQGGGFMYQYHAPGMTMLDDMSVTREYCRSGTDTLFAADFWEGNIVANNADGSGSGTVLVQDLYNPTSVRPGVGPGFTNGRTLFISEGGGIVPWTTDRRVWMLTLNDEYQC